MSLSCAGRLRSATADGVVIEVPNPPTSETTLLGSLAAVSFPIAAKVAGFVSEIIGLDTAADSALLVTLRLPEQLQIGERRSAVRIAVPRGTLHAAIVRQGKPQSVIAVDISLTGILIEVERDQQESVVVGHAATLRLTQGESEVTIDADVCRRDGCRFGLRYRTGAVPPPGLARVIYSIQQARRPRR
ncbi:MAG: PilZ domain-containing protein [Nannocystaceae bacterium]|nr:PilZ domain-containing protein [Nannocystaceae bacterium]